MKKVGIITYHFAKNYGAVLQCYALQSFLQEQGFNVEIINYVSDKQTKNNDYIKHGGIKALIKNTCLIPFKAKMKNKYEKFEIFNLNYLNLTKRVSNIAELKNLVKKSEYDVIISGSDQVFNPNIEDFDIAFLLPFKTNALKMSYAASTGNASTADLVNIRKYIDDFDYLSIREKSDLDKFTPFFKKNISVVCDPVMLLSNKFWDDKLNDRIIKEKYLICYFLHKNLFEKEYKLAKKIAKEKNLKLYVINARYSKYSFYKNTILDAGPIEFVNLIRYSDFVCTDSFHGTLFSIIFNKNFMCFDTKENLLDSRRLDLLNETKLQDNLQYIEDDNYILNTNFSSASEKIDLIRKQANIFLENIR